jgi:hypothetical protein
VATVQSLMRHASASITLNHYVQALTLQSGGRNAALSASLDPSWTRGWT